MSDNTKRQPAGIPVGGQFAANEHDEAGSSLAASEATIFDEVSQPLSLNEILDMQSDIGRYSMNQYDTADISLRNADLGIPKPSLRIDRDRPEFTDERDFTVALERIDALWDKDDTHRVRADRIIGDMRGSGALSSSSGREAYARALVLSESGIIDEEQVNHLLDHMDEGGTDYINQARAFGYHPEQFLSDLNTASAAAAYRSQHASSDDAERAALVRQRTLEDTARLFHAKTDRGWTTLEADTHSFRDRVRALDERLAGDLSGGAKDPKVAAEIAHNNRIDITAERDAYAFALRQIEEKWSAQ